MCSLIVPQKVGFSLFRNKVRDMLLYSAQCTSWLVVVFACLALLITHSMIADAESQSCLVLLERYASACMCHCGWATDKFSLACQELAHTVDLTWNGTGVSFPAHFTHVQGTSQPAVSQQEDSQRALHLFFQEYSKDHADDLANTCVLLICDAIAHSTLVCDTTTGSLLPNQTHHRLDTAQEASTLCLQVRFLAKLLQQSELPVQAVYDAVCANVTAVSMAPGAVEQWFQTGSAHR